MADDQETAELSKPRETEGEAPEPRSDIESVSFDDVAECLQAAKSEAEPRDELEIDYDERLETSTFHVTDEDFSDLVGDVFEIDLGQSRVKLKLTDVDRLGEAPDLDGDGAPDCRAPFRLVFEGHSPRNNLPEGWYRVDHPRFHDLTLAVEPLDPPEGETFEKPRLEANFN